MSLPLSLLVAFLNGAFFVTGRCVFPPLLPLPIDAAQVDGGLAVAFFLNFEAFMADLDIQPVPLIGSILNRCPLLPPNIDVRSLVVFPVFLPAKAIRFDGSGWHNNMDMGIIF